jgi:hypothetical protein
MKNTPHLATSRASILGGAFIASAVFAGQGTEPRELGYTQADQDLRGQPREPFSSSADEFVGNWVGSADDPLPPSESFPYPAEIIGAAPSDDDVKLADRLLVVGFNVAPGASSAKFACAAATDRADAQRTPQKGAAPRGVSAHSAVPR